MNFELTKTEQLFRQMIREFAENEVKPLAAEIDEEERFPVETVEKMAKLGIFGIPFPVNYGGAGGNNILYSMAVEELSRVCATTGVVVSAHTSLCAAPIYEHGTEEQKMKYLPKLCSGEWLGAFGLTEPNAGTDAAAQQTTAVDAGDHYILNGNKIFITNAAYAHVYIVMAMTDKSQGTRGISAFIVERDFPGFSIGKKEKKMGIRGSATCELIFENCIVPKENLLGKVGKGFSIAMKTLDGGRVGIASQALGIAQGAMDETVKYVKERKQFGRTIGQFQNTQFQLADLDTKIEAARLLVRAAAFKKDQKLPFSVDAARAKLFAAETAMEVTTKAVQFHGGYGYTREYPVERMMRDAKITEIYEGTVEVKSIAREPGQRSKVAVHSLDDRLDPVGACVGPKGSRVRAVVGELRGERVDVILWDADPAVYVANALSPAKVTRVLIDEEKAYAGVIVPDDQLSLAIGKEGQNARLAARLTGWHIDIKSETLAADILKNVPVHEEPAADLIGDEEDDDVRRCEYVSEDGIQCRNQARPGSRFCGVHDTDAFDDAEDLI